jgi:hypothetical protein
MAAGFVDQGRRERDFGEVAEAEGGTGEGGVAAAEGRDEMERDADGALGEGSAFGSDDEEAGADRGAVRQELDRAGAGSGERPEAGGEEADGRSRAADRSLEARDQPPRRHVLLDRGGERHGQCFEG